MIRSEPKLSPLQIARRLKTNVSGCHLEKIWKLPSVHQRFHNPFFKILNFAAVKIGNSFLLRKCYKIIHWVFLLKDYMLSLIRWIKLVSRDSNRYTGKIRRIFTPSGRKEAGVAEPARLGGRVAASSNLVIPTTEHQQIEVGEIRLFGYS